MFETEKSIKSMPPQPTSNLIPPPPGSIRRRRDPPDPPGPSDSQRFRWQNSRAFWLPPATAAVGISASKTEILRFGHPETETTMTFVES